MSMIIKNDRDLFLSLQSPRINQEGLPPEMVIPGLKQVLLRASDNHFRVKYGGEPEGSGVIQIEANLVHIVGTPVFTATSANGTVPLQATINERVKLLRFEDMDADRIEVRVEVEDESAQPLTELGLPTVYRADLNIVKLYDRPPLEVDGVITDFQVEGRIDSVIVTVNAQSTVDRVVELWRAAHNQTLPFAVKVGEFEGTRYEDLNLALFTPYRYWVRLKDTVHNMTGAFVGPKTATTGQITATIDALEGRIAETTLHQSLRSRIVDIEESVTTEAVSRTLAIQAEAQARLDAIAVETGSRNFAVNQLSKEIEEVDGRVTVVSQDVTALSNQVANNLSSAVSSLSTEIEEVDGRVTAVSQDLVSLKSQVDDDVATAISNLTTKVEDDLGSVAEDVTQLSTTVDGHTSTLQTQAQSINGLSASYSVRIDNNGRVAGYGLASGEGGTSDFTVLTDRFSIFDAANPTQMVLGTENGNTFIRGAYIDKVVASQIDSRGLSIKDNSGNVILSAGTALDWNRIGGTGKPANNATQNRIFRQTTQPSGSHGDIWIDTGTNPNRELINVSGTWQVAATVGATFNAGQAGTITGRITSSNASTYIANAAIGSAQIGSVALVGTNNFSVKTGTSGARMEMDSRVIKVFDANGVLRVRLGNLTV